MKKHKIPIRYYWENFTTLGEIAIESRTLQSAKTKALKIARKRARQDKIKAELA